MISTTASTGILFETMVELYNEGAPVDLITLQNRLREKNVPPEISSLEYVRDLYETKPVSANTEHYAKIVSEKAVLRRLIKVAEILRMTAIRKRTVWMAFWSRQRKIFLDCCRTVQWMIMSRYRK